ncbi:MAG: hypothetical protein Q4A42_06980 [Tissierellia bacterium]|nr:hypothetical protein [Tissierellia bacterium]
MVNIYKNISYIFIGMSLIFLMLSILIYFKFEIKKILGELSGKTIKKSIEDIKNKNINRNIYNPSSTSYMTNPIFSSELKSNIRQNINDFGVKSGYSLEEIEHRNPEESNQTEVLSETFTTVLYEENKNFYETEVLSVNTDDIDLRNKESNHYEIIEEIIISDTNNTIGR